MNWWKKAKKRCKVKEDGKGNWGVLDTQLLCCQYEENRRKDPYKREEAPNYPGGKNNEVP